MLDIGSDLNHFLGMRGLGLRVFTMTIHYDMTPFSFH